MKILKSKTTFVGLLLVAVLLGALELYRDDTEASLGEEIESRGSRLLGTRLDVGDVSLDRGAGRVVLSDLAVANPGGFSSGDMISVESVTMRIDRDGRVIERMTFSGVDAVVEFRGAQGNFETLADRVAKRSERATAPPDEADDGGEAEQSTDEAEREQDDTGAGASARDDWRVNRVEFERIGIRVQADWTSEVLEFDAGGLSVDSLDAGVDDLVRAVAVQFLHRVLVSAADQVDDERLKAGLLDRARALRVGRGS
ncbi:MAG: hypothetical protein U5R46_11870 [Gammaproteobacteria bacterium]|nr:hypothetical protein [Gammaproteobacteria bacterium]